MNLRDKVNTLTVSLWAKVSGKGTLPEQAAALEAANAIAENPLALSEARARITQLEGELANANQKIADTEQRVNALVEQRVGAVRAENTRLLTQARSAQERAIEIAAACGQTAPAGADANKSTATTTKTTLTGIEAVEAQYRQQYEGREFPAP